MNRLMRCCAVAVVCAAQICILGTNLQAQEVVDKMVASVGRQLITFSDLVWQLALQPETPIDQPRSDDLNRALQLVINQRLILQEAEALPSIAPKDEEIDAAIKALMQRFHSDTEFYDRIHQVGLNSDQLREIIRQRLRIENYLDFRFRSFTVVTMDEQKDYYNTVYVPKMRQEAPGRIVPTFEQAQAEILRTLTESKVESDTDAFIEDARSHANIQMLNPV